MSDSDVDHGPVLSRDQTLWVFVTLAWLVVGAVALTVGNDLLGYGGLLLGVLSVYRVYNPG